MKPKPPYHATSSSLQQNRKNHHLEVAATLDLHGYRKNEALARVTAFLDIWRKKKSTRGNIGGDVCWVCIVTGTGQHSPDGPVLRNAVESLLERRQMVYMMNPGRGSITANAKSGIVFYKPGPPTDTKLLFTGPVRSSVKLVGRPSPSSAKPLSTNFAKLPSPDELTTETSTDSSSLSRAGQDSNSSVGGGEDQDELFERILQTSKEEFEKKERKRDYKHQRALQKAKDASRVESEKTTFESDREEDMLRRIMIQSEREHEQDQMEEEAALRQALSASTQLATEPEQLSNADLELAIQQAMAASLQDVNSPSENSRCEEGELERVLALSLEES